MKKAWSKPELNVYGTVEELTMTRTKRLGLNDGVALTAPDGSPVSIVDGAGNPIAIGS